MSTTAWDQREGESPKAYQAFCAYRDMGADRSIVKAHRRLSQTDAGRAPRHWDVWAFENDWKTRAAAYDTHLELIARQVREEEHRTEVRAYRERARKSAAALSELTLVALQKASARLIALDPSEIKAGDLPHFLRAAAQIMDTSLNAEAEAVGVRELENIFDNAKGAGVPGAG